MLLIENRRNRTRKKFQVTIDLDTAAKLLQSVFIYFVEFIEVILFQYIKILPAKTRDDFQYNKYLYEFGLNKLRCTLI